MTQDKLRQIESDREAAMCLKINWLKAEVEKLTKERDATLKAFAEMRDVLLNINHNRHLLAPGHSSELIDFVRSVNHALSTDCGKGYVPKAELDAMRKNRDECAQAMMIPRDHEITEPIKDCGCAACNLHHKYRFALKPLVEALRQVDQCGMEHFKAFSCACAGGIKQALAHAERITGGGE